MYCQNCNKSFSDDYSFCDTCGGKLEKENIAEISQSVDTTPVAPLEPDIQPEPQPSPIQPAPVGFAPPPPQPQPQPIVEPQQNNKQSKTVSFGAWMGILFLNIIPVMFGVFYTLGVIIGSLSALDNINPIGIAFLAFAVLYIILLFVWAFGKPKARSLKNYAKATLLMSLIVIIIGIVGFFLLRDAVMDMLPQLPDFGNFTNMPF